jgi:hypothetical protein
LIDTRKAPGGYQGQSQTEFEKTYYLLIILAERRRAKMTTKVTLFQIIKNICAALKKEWEEEQI